MKQAEPTIKEQLMALGMKEEEFSYHESDLYVLKNDISEKWLSTYPFRNNVKVFIEVEDMQDWYDIPFGYMNEMVKGKL